MTEPFEMNAAETARRSESLREIINDLIVRRAAGETVTDESLIEQHPELMPELADELRNLRIVECAEQDAQSVPRRVTHPLPALPQPGRSWSTMRRCPRCCARRAAANSVWSTTRIGRFRRQPTGDWSIIFNCWTRSAWARSAVSGARATRSWTGMVAIKIPRKGELSLEDGELFIREARAAAQLKHPHIVSVLEVGRHEDRIYIVTEFVQGLDLADWLDRPTGHAARSGRAVRDAGRRPATRPRPRCDSS